MQNNVSSQSGYSFGFGSLHGCLRMKKGLTYSICGTKCGITVRLEQKWKQYQNDF